MDTEDFSGTAFRHGRSRILAKNLALLGQREKAQKRERTLGQRVCYALTCWAGHPRFMVGHALWFLVWIGVNTGWMRGFRPFDPFPFAFLTLVVSLESIFLSLAILMSQSLETKQADERAKLDLQINLLAEQESTKTLELLQALCRKQGMPEADDPELLELLQPTEADRVLEELEQNEKETGQQAKTVTRSSAGPSG